MSAFVIVGAGGLGRELFGWIAGGSAETRERFRVTAFISEGDDVGGNCHGVPILHPDAWRGAPPRFVMGFAAPVAKKRMVLDLEARGWLSEIFIHESAAVGISAQIGSGTVICPFCRISSDSVIGRHVLINGGSGVGHDVTVGDYTALLGAVSVNGHTTVGEGVTFGANSTIFPGKKAGDWSTIGMGSVVLRNVPAHATVFGNPAKRIDR